MAMVIAPLIVRKGAHGEIAGSFAADCEVDACAAATTETCNASPPKLLQELGVTCSAMLKQPLNDRVLLGGQRPIYLDVR